MGEEAARHPSADARGLEKRLIVLMAARLALSLLSLGIGIGLDVAGDELTLTNRRGFYTTVALAFLATGVYGVLLRRLKNPKPFAALNIATDIAFVTAMVYCSGGTSSVFTFFYVLVAVYGAVLFERQGALVSAGAGALAYGAVLLAGNPGWMVGGLPASEPPQVLFTRWVVHAGAILLVASLASFLSAELRRADAALFERTSDLERLQRLHERTVQSLMSGLLTVDSTGLVTSFNPEAERITGLDVSVAVGRDVDEILPHVRSQVIARSEKGDAHSRSRMPYCNERGQDLHLGVAAYILRASDGSPDGHVLIFQDVSRVVEMENDLRRSERLAAVGELSASIAHEIRNPLAAISGSIQLLEGRIGANKDLASRRLMEIVLRETDRLNHLITDFLVYARPGPLHLDSVRLADALAGILKMFEAVRPEPVEVVVDVPDDIGVLADASRLHQVLWNLILNASEAMPGGGRLLIAARPCDGVMSQDGASGLRNEEENKGSWVEISVADEGVGIAPDVRERIFDPFYTTKQDGTGLGLATVHRVVEDHGGTLRLESEPGNGTAIHLRLPRAEVS